MPEQHARHINLRTVLARLDAEGIAGYAEQAAFIGEVTELSLSIMDGGGDIDGLFARHVEWAVQRRNGWMDELHSDPLEI
ncbi:hypothetical protein P3W24_04595 [Luteibacter sp. PPL201]|uniref:Uncharacterized protein n=1 Tax=Luteibacter sahnii TaxID=3021977 RepID=A0ABT6B871_9GAMM|nr:hypothetical protein [Luteibacter sp. PPL193]MDY1547850.1 hypothetical protein [Luteibacter sp. PPL193]